MRPTTCRTRRGLYLQLRMHILHELCQANKRRLSKLRRRTRAPSASDRQRIVVRPFCPPGAYPPSCLAKSAARAKFWRVAKKAGDWPMKSPMSVRNLTTPMATPFVSVGRMIETMGRLRSRNGHGSGMIRALSKSSFSTSRSGKVTETPVTGSTAVKGGALPATSDQV